MSLTRRQKWLQRCLRASWLVVFIAFVVFLVWPENKLAPWVADSVHRAVRDAFASMPTPETQGQQITDASIDRKDPLKVYGEDDSFTLWSRDDAVQFGFEKVTNTIVYLWVAASVLLGLIGRFMIDPLLDRTKGKLIDSPTTLILVRHSAIGSLISICFGFVGYLYFVDVVNAEEFTIYNEIAIATFCQIVAFMLAAFLLMLAVNSVVTRHLNMGKKEP